MKIIVIPDQFEFYFHKFPNEFYEACREGNEYIIEWTVDDGELRDNAVYSVSDVSMNLSKGIWVIVTQ